MPGAGTANPLAAASSARADAGCSVGLGLLGRGAAVMGWVCSVYIFADIGVYYAVYRIMLAQSLV